MLLFEPCCYLNDRHLWLCFLVSGAAPAAAGAGGYESDEMEIEDEDAAPAPAAPAAVAVEVEDAIEVDDVTPGDGETETPQEYLRRVGVPIPGPSAKWASCIRLFDPVSVRFLAFFANLLAFKSQLMRFGLCWSSMFWVAFTQPFAGAFRSLCVQHNGIHCSRAPCAQLCFACLSWRRFK